MMIDIRWLIGTIIALASLIITILAWRYPIGSASPRPDTSVSSSAPAGGTAQPTPTVGELKLNQLQVGDCLTGSNLKLNTSDPWPDRALAVPCSQAHTAEVFLADTNYWQSDDSYPGDNAKHKAANAACVSAFKSYVGIDESASMYSYVDVTPDASAWNDGDRDLHCIAYDSTDSTAAGATMYKSIKGTGQ